MWCARIRKQLSAHADGELSLSEAREVEEHVAHCERCATEQRSLQQLARLTALVPDEELPSSLHARIMSGVRHAALAPLPSTPARHRRAIPLGPWGFVAFSGSLAALIFGVLHAQVGQHSGTPGEVASVDVRTVTEKGGQAAAPADPTPAKPKAISTQAPPAAPAPAAAVAQAPAVVTAPADVPAVTPAPVRRAATPRVAAVPSSKPDATRAETRPAAPAATVASTNGEKPAAEPAMPTTMAVAMGTGTGDAGTTPAVVMAARTDSTPSEKEPVTRMATNPVEMEPAKDDDEGLSSLKNFLRDRSKTVPQPPLLDPSKDRHGRRSL